ncbi:MAG TPA: hypothetical protein V6D17_11305 [Candidatus Obscuribacterales bacterium]
MAAGNSPGGKRISDLLIIGTFIVAGLSLGWMQAHTWSKQVGMDTASYLEIADAVLRGDWKELFRSYWSPLFPLFIALLKGTAGAGSDELVVLEWAVFASFAFSLVAFLLFARQLLRLHDESDIGYGYISLTARQLKLVLLSIFLYCSLAISEISHKTPDPLATGVCLLALSVWLPMCRGKNSTPRSLLLGFLLGLSYWAKNFNLSWAPPMVLMLIVLRKQYKLEKTRLAALLVAFIVSVSALVIPISLVAGRFTFTDVGVSGAWSGQTGMRNVKHLALGANGRGPEFLHPTRIFSTNPTFYEFATPFDVSYPVFYAPHYWYEGVKYWIDWRHYLFELWNKILIYIVQLGAFVFVFLAFRFIGRSFPLSRERLILFSPDLIANLIGLALLFFMLEQAARYYPSTLIPLLSLLVASVKLPNTALCRRGVTAGAMFLIIVMMAGLSFKSLMVYYFYSPAFAHAIDRAAKTQGPPSPPVSGHVEIISALKNAGIKPGDRVARIGFGDFYWAKGAGVKIVCESNDLADFWSSTPESRQVLYKKLKDFGVKAIVQDGYLPKIKAEPHPKDPGWTKVEGLDAFIYVLP